MTPETSLYWYRAKVISVYDGDTMTLDIDLGLQVWLRSQKVRLYGIDTPELRGSEREEGLKVRDAVRVLAEPDTDVLIKTYKDRSGKFGRWLVEVWVPSLPLVSLNQWLVESGMAKDYYP